MVVSRRDYHIAPCEQRVWARFDASRRGKKMLILETNVMVVLGFQRLRRLPEGIVSKTKVSGDGRRISPPSKTALIVLTTLLLILVMS